MLLSITIFSTPAFADIGYASWYGYESGKFTASGERFLPLGLTAAHRSLPFNTQIRVTRVDTGKSVVLRINDRGPAKWTKRIVDISKGAALQLGMIKMGVARVKLEVISK